MRTATTTAIVNVILEEYGHYIDSQINHLDSAGDEGAIFAALVQGQHLNDAMLANLRKENDHALIEVNGEMIHVEQANRTGTTGDDNLTGTEENDSIDGLAGNDYLSGEAGNDSLNGGVGNDTLVSDYGNDTINGGTGFDAYFASYTDRSTGLTMTYDPQTGNGTIKIGSEVDTLISIESFNAGRALSGGFEGTDFNDVIIGTSDNENYLWYGLNGRGGDDTVSGGAGDDKVVGGEGNDVLNGDSGNDELYGESGNDSLNGGVGNDKLVSDFGNDTINGGTGFDTYFASYTDRSTGLTMTYDPQTGNGTITIGSEVDTLISIESFNEGRALSGGFEGTDFNDLIIGTSDNENYLWYGLNGRGGDDTVSGGAGDDKVVGGEGNDVLNGDSGNDELYGESGNDSLNGGFGNDKLVSDFGNDTINGGTGFDTYFASYADRSSGLTMIYDPQTGNGTITIGSEVDTLISIESFNEGRALSGGFEGTDFNDLILGTSDNENYLYYGLNGRGGDDTVSGGAGDDKILGGEGNDVVNGDSGNDELYGDEGNDRLQGANLGKGEEDVLYGGTGSDLFILADASKVFYDDDLSNNAGEDDFARVADFNTTEDAIQLKGSSSDYLLVTFEGNTKLYLNKPGAEPDELIAVINDQSALSLTASYFKYVSNPILPVITLAVSPSSVMEDGAANLVYRFTRSGSNANALTVNYSIAGTAIANDYVGATPGSGKTITFNAGSSTATLTIDPVADTNIEANETVQLTLNTGVGYTIGTSTAVTGVITNDDSPSITLALANSSVREDGATNIVYTFTRTGPTTSPLSVKYSIAGSASATDYTGASPGANTVTFAANSTTASVTLDPTADTIVEPTETIALTLVSGNGYKLGTTTSVGSTILDDDIASSNSYTLTASQSSLLLLGTRRIYGMGNELNNVITGNSNNNRLYGMLGADVLTGGGASDADVYAYTSLSETLLGQGASFDQVTDFTSNDRFMAPLSVETDRLTSSLGNAASLSAASIDKLLTTTSFLANSVAAFTASGYMGTFVAMNDERAGYQAETDAIVLLRNYAISSNNYVDFV